jgi:D-arabinose 1-dehydrogenase-like Zn-dependent alcohol dehydrogenase
MDVGLSLLPMISEQITVCGSIMGTLQDMKDMIAFIASAGIAPEIGNVLPMEHAKDAFRAMWEGKTHGKTVFTR